MDEKPTPQSEAQQQAKLRSVRLALAFQTVFGQPGRRTVAQESVLAYLEEGIDDDNTNSFGFNQARDGLAIVAAGIHRDGAKSILRIIKRQLSKAAEVRNEKPKPAVKVKR